MDLDHCMKKFTIQTQNQSNIKGWNKKKNKNNNKKEWGPNKNK
jgi:hypothetical protein